LPATATYFPDKSQWHGISRMLCSYSFLFLSTTINGSDPGRLYISVSVNTDSLVAGFPANDGKEDSWTLNYHAALDVLLADITDY
jgi:hypothetical protein